MRKMIASLLVCALVWSQFVPVSVAEAAPVVSGGAVSGESGSTVAPPTTPPATDLPAIVVTGIRARKASNLKQVTVTWKADSRVTNYFLFRKIGKGKFVKIATLSGNKYIDKKVKPGKTYFYYVSAYNIAGKDVSPIAKVSIRPGAIKRLKAKRIRGGVSLRWKKTKGVSGYQVQMKFFVKGFKTSYSHAKFTKVRRYKRKMLIRGRRFGFRVRAYRVVKGKRIYGRASTVVKRAG